MTEDTKLTLHDRADVVRERIESLSSRLRLAAHGVFSVIEDSFSSEIAQDVLPGVYDLLNDLVVHAEATALAAEELRGDLLRRAISPTSGKEVPDGN